MGKQGSTAMEQPRLLPFSVDATPFSICLPPPTSGATRAVSSSPYIVFVSTSRFPHLCLLIVIFTQSISPVSERSVASYTTFSCLCHQAPSLARSHHHILPLVALVLVRVDDECATAADLLLSNTLANPETSPLPLRSLLAACE